MRNSLVLLLPLALAGCASHPQVMEGNSKSVIVDARAAGKIEGALAVADKYCAQYGKAAQFKGKLDEFQFAYDCVAADPGRVLPESETPPPN